jgi:hypothetical protein
MLKEDKNSSVRGVGRLFEKTGPGTRVNNLHVAVLWVSYES